MRLVTYHLVTKPTLTLATFETPFELDLADGLHCRIEEADGDWQWRIIASGAVSHDDLQVLAESGVFREDPDGTRHPQPRIVVTEPRDRGGAIADALRALAFCLDAPLDESRVIHEDRLEPDSPADERFLSEAGTDRLDWPFAVEISGGSVRGRVSPDAVAALAGQQAGLRLYADALRLNVVTSRYRELWRVLESAFTTTDADLVDLLTRYDPIVQLGADRAELQDLLVVRGRASHAQSKAGAKEIATVERLCTDRINRLKEIAGRLIETKQSWGYPTTAWTELLPPGTRFALYTETVRSE